MTPSQLSRIMGCPLDQADSMLNGTQYRPISLLHEKLTNSSSLATAGVKIGSAKHNFEVYFSKPNPYGATSLRVVIEHGNPALFASSEGVGSATPKSGPRVDEIVTYADAADIVQAILEWTR
mmetsp:Transcript_26645/g.35500  ORF Transcript_26645/g.35500 Transcript_26645/m.35500 type:complete len:122 (+) Transcript_26645:601-966(+)